MSIFLKHIKNSAGFFGSFFEKPIFLTAARMEGAIILLYHRVSTDYDPIYPAIHPDVFRSHIKIINSYFNIIPLDVLVRRLKSKESLQGFCAITFDDGYKDFISYAYPILKEFKVPVSHFITSESLINGIPNWNYRLNRILHHFNLDENLKPLKRLNGSPQWSEILEVTKRLATYSHYQREKILSELEMSCDLTSAPQMICAADIVEMDNEIVQWGSHTVFHTSLTGCSKETIAYELYTSRKKIEESIGHNIDFIAYPNGHFDDLTMQIAEESGYSASFTVGQRRVKMNSNIYAIPRFDAGTLPLNLLGLEILGITPLFRKIKCIFKKFKMHQYH